MPSRDICPSCWAMRLTIKHCAAARRLTHADFPEPAPLQPNVSGKSCPPGSHMVTVFVCLLSAMPSNDFPAAGPNLLSAELRPPLCHASRRLNERGDSKVHCQRRSSVRLATWPAACCLLDQSPHEIFARPGSSHRPNAAGPNRRPPC